MGRVANVLGAGVLALAGWSGGAAAAEMTFSLVPMNDPATCGKKCVQVISAEGEIGPSTPDRFVDFVRRNIRDKSVRSVVFIHSPGGRVVASMELGMALRKLGAATVVARIIPPEPGSGKAAWFASARCFSACVYALMGGKKRVVPPQSSVGIHRMFMYERSMDPETGQSLSRVYADDDLVGSLSRYVRMMGISNDLVKTAERTSPDMIHVVSPRELKAWRLGSQKF